MIKKTILLFLTLSASLQAATVTLAWDRTATDTKNEPIEGVGYAAYIVGAGATQTVETVSNTASFLDIDVGRPYTAYVIAKTTNALSEPSDPLSVLLVPELEIEKYHLSTEADTGSYTIQWRKTLTEGEWLDIVDVSGDNVRLDISLITMGWSTGYFKLKEK